LYNAHVWFIRRKQLSLVERRKVDVARVNVFIGEDLLRAVDDEARRKGMKRSALFREALDQYLEAQRKAREEVEVRRRMEDACKKMDVIAEKLGDWNPVEIIRESRDARYGRVSVPSRLSKKRRAR